MEVNMKRSMDHALFFVYVIAFIRLECCLFACWIVRYEKRVNMRSNGWLSFFLGVCVPSIFLVLFGHFSFSVHFKKKAKMHMIQIVDTEH